jgi:integrase
MLTITSKTELSTEERGAMKKRKRRKGVYYREERGKWGYRIYFRGTSYKKFAWATREEAQKALNEFKRELDNLPNEPTIEPTALVVAVNDYLADAMESKRSDHRVKGARYNFNKVIIPFFGKAKPIGSITTPLVEAMLKKRRAAGMKPKTLLHDLTNINALLNWAARPKVIEEGGEKREIPPLIKANPLDVSQLREFIGSTKNKKPPLDLGAVERAAAALTGEERVYFDFMRFLGPRKDEANRAEWDDINFETALVHIRGTKTDEADNYLPLSPYLLDALRTLKENSTSKYVFPGKSKKTKGKRIYSRARLFQKIERLTSSCRDCGGTKIAKRRHCLDCKKIEAVSRTHYCSKCKSKNVHEGIGCIGCGSTNLNPGIKLRPKDLRDVFASTVKTQDPRVLMDLMRHTNLNTTTKYLRSVNEAMRDAVQHFGQTSTKTLVPTLGANLGANQNAQQVQKSVQNSSARFLAELLQAGPQALELLESTLKNLRKMGIGSAGLSGKVGGGGQIRTVDAADMSRVL